MNFTQPPDNDKNLTRVGNKLGNKKKENEKDVDILDKKNISEFYEKNRKFYRSVTSFFCKKSDKLKKISLIKSLRPRN